jgi:hypothetical protein
MPRTAHRTAEDWAKLLGTRVLRPEEFDGIAVGPHTQGWSALEAALLPADPIKLQAFLRELTVKGQVIAGVLPADGDHPIRIVTRHQRHEAHQQAPQRKRVQQRRRQEA